MRKSLMFSLFLMYGQISYCQNSMPVFTSPKEKDIAYKHNLNLYLSDYYQSSNSFPFNKVCLKGLTFIKFRIGKQGDIRDISCSVGTDSLLCKYLKDKIMTTNKLWTPEKNKNGQAIVSSFLVWPFYYDLPMGCAKTRNEFEDISTIAQDVGNMNKFQDGTTTDGQKIYMLPNGIWVLMPQYEIETKK